MSIEYRDAIPEVFVHDIGDMEIIDGIFHCVFYAVRDTHTGKPWREPLLRFATPASKVPLFVERALAALAQGAMFTLVDKLRGASRH